MACQPICSGCRDVQLHQIHPCSPYDDSLLDYRKDLGWNDRTLVLRRDDPAYEQTTNKPKATDLLIGTPPCRRLRQGDFFSNCLVATALGGDHNHLI